MPVTKQHGKQTVGMSPPPTFQQGAARSIGAFDKLSRGLSVEVRAAQTLPERMTAAGQHLEQLLYSGLHDSKQGVVVEVFSIWGCRRGLYSPAGYSPTQMNGPAERHWLKGVCRPVERAVVSGALGL